MAKRANAPAIEPDQVWIIPIYERRGGYEDGLSFMSLYFTTIIPLDSSGNFSYAYADQNAPEGVPVIDAYVPLYGHYGDDHTAFTGNVLMLLANSEKASSLDLEDRKEAIIGFVALDAEQGGTTLVGIPLGTVTSGADVDLGEITPDGEGDEAIAETPLADVEEYFELSLNQLLVMAETDDMLKAIANQFVNSKLVPENPDSSMSGLHEEGKTDTDNYEWWHGGLQFMWFGDSMFMSEASNLPRHYLGRDTMDMPIWETNEIDEDNPAVLRVINSVWEPGNGFADVTYVGHGVRFGTNTGLSGVSVTAPPTVDTTGIITNIEHDAWISFASEDQQGNYYFPPVPGQPHVAPGWWDINSGGGLAATFQMDLASPFDDQNNVLVLVPRVELVLQDTMLVADLWRWNMDSVLLGGVSQGETFVPDGNNSIDTGKTWIDLQKIAGLNITWYHYSNGSYVPADPEILSPGMVFIDISVQMPRRFNNYTYNQNGWPQSEGTAITPDSEFYYEISHGESDNIQLQIDDDINILVPHDSHNSGSLLYGSGDAYHYSGEVVDGVYWESFAKWAHLKGIHISYIFNGVEFRFSFNDLR